MSTKPKIGIIGYSDGEPEVHDELKGFVQSQVDAIKDALIKDARVDIVEASSLVYSVSTARNMALEMVKEDVDGVIFSYGVFSFPNFTVVSAQNLQCPILLAANLNPDWPGMVSMLASGGALNQLGIEHFRVAGDVNDKDVLEKVIDFAKAAHVVTSLKGSNYGLIGGRKSWNV